MTTDSALDTKYRPKTLDEFLGNESLKESLQTIIVRTKDIPNAFLFHGAAGCGKTTLGRIVANILGCNELDYYELNISDTRGIEAARNLISMAKYKPMGGKIKVYCLNEVHSSTPEFQNALLTTMEEPPKHLKFILCTTEPQKLKKTILQRCRSFEVKPLSQPLIRILVNKVLENEGITEFPKEAIQKISDLCEGSPRQALNLLDKVIDIPDDNKLLEVLDNELEVLKQEAKVGDLFKSLLNKEPWNNVIKILNMLPDTNYEGLRIYIRNACASTLLKKESLQAAIILDSFSKPFPDKAEIVFMCYQSIR
jgi:DNA polymerase III subunit gamma/tau